MDYIVCTPSLTFCRFYTSTIAVFKCMRASSSAVRSVLIQPHTAHKIAHSSANTRVHPHVYRQSWCIYLIICADTRMHTKACTTRAQNSTHSHARRCTKPHTKPHTDVLNINISSYYDYHHHRTRS